MKQISGRPLWQQPTMAGLQCGPRRLLGLRFDTVMTPQKKVYQMAQKTKKQKQKQTKKKHKLLSGSFNRDCVIAQKWVFTIFFYDLVFMKLHKKIVKTPIVQNMSIVGQRVPNCFSSTLLIPFCSLLKYLFWDTNMHFTKTFATVASPLHPFGY